MLDDDPYQVRENRMPAGVGALVIAGLWALGSFVNSRNTVAVLQPACTTDRLGLVKAFYWFGVPVLAYAIVRAIRAGRRRNQLIRYVLAGILVIGGLILAHRTIVAGAYCPPELGG